MTAKKLAIANGNLSTATGVGGLSDLEFDILASGSAAMPAKQSSSSLAIARFQQEGH
jgi:hypothetical protein